MLHYRAIVRARVESEHTGRLFRFLFDDRSTIPVPFCENVAFCSNIAILYCNILVF